MFLGFSMTKPVRYEEILPLKIVTLRVVSDHFVAGADFEKENGKEWKCVRAAPIIKYMEKMTCQKIKEYIQEDRS